MEGDADDELWLWGWLGNRKFEGKMMTTEERWVKLNLIKTQQHDNNRLVTMYEFINYSINPDVWEVSWSRSRCSLYFQIWGVQELDILKENAIYPCFQIFVLLIKVLINVQAYVKSVNPGVCLVYWSRSRCSLLFWVAVVHTFRSDICWWSQWVPEYVEPINSDPDVGILCWSRNHCNPWNQICAGQSSLGSK